MAERRSAAAALTLDTKLEDFIKSGMPGSTPNPAPVVNVKPAEKQKAKPKKVSEEQEEPVAPKQKRSTPKEKKPEPVTQESPAFARTLARARIQKSIRFLPNLIAQFEEHCRAEEMEGRKPISIQDALNEALDMWLGNRR